MNYLFHLTIYLSIYIILALSLNLVIGYCGLITLAHAGYFAVGSYVYALASLKLGLGFVPSILLGMGIGAILSFAISLPSWRLKGDFFIMISLAVQVLFFNIFYNWTSPGADIGSLSNLTNGPFGIENIPNPAILGIKFDTIGSIALLSLCITGGCAFFSWLLISSPWSRLLKAMRDDELAIRGLGKNTRLIKVQAFMLACGMAALAGAIYASYVSFIDPSTASFDESILMLCMVIVGGVGNFRGPIVGALVLLMLPELFRLIQLPNTVAANIQLLGYGLLLIVMMHFRPQGIAGEYRMD